MRHKFNSIALQAAIFYGIAAGIWILFSDQLLGDLIEDKQQLTQMEIYKGLLSVVLTSGMFFFILRLFLKREAVKIRELQKADALNRLQQETLQKIAVSKPLKETLTFLLHGIEAQSPGMTASILLLEGTQLRHGAAPSLPEAYTKAIDGMTIGPQAGSCGTAAFRGSPVFVGDIDQDPLWVNYKHLALAHRLRSCWSTPILDEQKKVLGTFAIYHREIGLPHENDVRIIELVTHTAATAIVKDRTEKNLRSSEERFRILVENASDAIFVHDDNGRLLDVNHSACESLNYSQKELLQMKVTDIERDMPLEKIQQIWRKLEPGQSQLVRSRHRRKDGTSFPVEISVSRYEIQGEQVFAAMARNLSGRKEYEDQLAESVSLLRATIESSPSGMLVVDRQGKITTYNNRFLEMWRIPAEIMNHGDDQAVLNLVLDQLQAPDAFLKRVQELYTQPDAESYDTLHFKDGRVFDRVSRPQRLSSKIIGRVWSFRDMTQQAQAEQSMRLQSVALEAAANAILITDVHGNIEWANPAFSLSSGYTLAECIGKPPRELIYSGKHSKEFFEGMWKTILSGKVWHGELTNRRKSGHFYLEEMTITPLMDATNRITHFVAIKQDITEKTRLEKDRQNLESQLRQSQKMEAVGQLSGGIAHDFNNILTVIQGNAALLQGLDLQPQEIHDCSNQIARAAERAASLTRQLLMFARKQQMDPVNLNLNEAVAQMTKMLQRILGEDIALHSEYSPVPPLVYADVGMIEQIILNLAVNARDAMPAGGKLTIRTKVEDFKPAASSQSPAKPYACLSVTDTGCGIPPEILPRIFEPFFTTKEIGKGTGLGLATVYGIVQQHHGEIKVQSEPGKGTTFNVFLQIVATAEATQPASQVKPVLPWGQETILLVEDEFTLRAFVSDLLQRCGYTVLEAESGPAALKVWQQHRDRIQLLLTDIIMPENMNGIQLASQLLGEKPKLKVIYTSGYTGNLDGRHAQLKEGDNFIRKPFKPETLAEIIRNKLDNKTPVK